jgi:hypothetical protein
VSLLEKLLLANLSILLAQVGTTQKESPFHDAVLAALDFLAADPALPAAASSALASIRTIFDS